MTIPLCDLRAEHAAIEEELVEAFRTVVRSGRYVLGDAVRDFEERLAARVGVPHAVAVASGSDALVLALRGAGVGAGDVVLTTALSFVATAEAIARVGARAIFADVDRATFALDPARCEARLVAARADGANVRAVLVVHLFGQCARVDVLEALCKRHRIALLEDAAQALGARIGGRSAGGFGRAAAHSFFPTKNLGGFGDGGAVTTHDPALAATARRLRQHGFDERGDVAAVGLNSRLDALQAALLAVKERYLDRVLAARRATAARYDALLAPLAPRVVRQALVTGAEPTWHQYVVRVPRRDEVAARLVAAGIEARAYYARPLHRMAAFATDDVLPETDALAGEILALPMFNTITEEQQGTVVDELKRALDG